MSETIRFHLDENVNPVIAVALRRYGVDVTTTGEANLRTSSDEEQLAYAQRENRVIVTHDDDFLRLANRILAHPGVAYCHKEARTIGEIINSLRLIYEVLTPDEICGRVEYLQAKAMRDYFIGIFYSEEDEGYIADVPDLHYCSAFGETPEEALREVQLAKEAWLEAARASGEEIPVPQFRPVIYQLDSPLSVV